MPQLITITPQWQIYVPTRVREQLGLTQSSKARLEVAGDKLIITPQKSALLSLGGKYKSLAKKKLNLETVRDQIDYSRL
ncbi:AbrB/MazE/SpoVT family DNA-binding domain-containing protein [Patescibacteria group bacterium]|nr:AbrB/MazE/SpoVT family DNA-binding domain-containing protein [Patescibacteria group bacterium]